MKQVLLVTVWLLASGTPLQRKAAKISNFIEPRGRLLLWNGCENKLRLNTCGRMDEADTKRRKHLDKKIYCMAYAVCAEQRHKWLKSLCMSFY